MKTLLLPARYTPDSIALAGAAVQAGWEVERLGSWHVPPRFQDSDVAIYGEAVFAKIVADQLSLVLVSPPEDWLVHLPAQYLLRQVVSTTLREAKGRRRRAFFKPAGDKCFAAGVYEDGMALPVSEAVPGDTPVLISEPVVWENELRFFVMDRRVCTFSPYAQKGEIDVTSALSFCAGLLAEPVVEIPPAVAIDVGTIEGRGWAVVEANAAWASGIYQCDPRKVLEVVAGACRRTGGGPGS